jgi:hypothetical protein
MKSIINLVMLLFISGLTFGQNNQADTTKKKDQKNTVIPQQVHITPEASGVKRSIGYRFSSSTVAGDPGNGVFRYDKGAAADIKYLFVDDIDISGEDQTKWYSTWDKNTGAAGRGGLTIADKDGKVIGLFNFTNVFNDADGFWKLPVEYISGNMPQDGTACYYVFDRISHQKPAVQEVKPAETNNVIPTVAAVAEVAAVTEISQVTQVAQVTQVTQVTELKEVKEEKEEQQQVTQVTEQKEVKEEKQVSQAVVTAVAATEVAVVTQTNNQVQAVVTEPPVQAVVVVPPVEIKDSTKVIPATQGNQVVVAAVVTTEVVAVTQAANPPRVAQVNTQGATQVTQSKPVTQTVTPAQTKPATQVAVTAPAATTVAVQTTPKTQTTQITQTTQPAQQTQSNQAAQPNNQPPAKQYNQFPVVQNIFASGGSGSGHRRWYRGIIEVGYGFGLGDYGINNFRFNFINAIRIGDFSSIGLGIGYRRFFTKNDAAPYLVSNVDQIPFFLDLRTSFSTRKLTPYAALGIGASRGYRSAATDKGLFMFNASGGIWYNVSGRFAVFAGIAYEMQKLQYSDTDPFANSYIKSAGSISLNIGISF